MPGNADDGAVQPGDQQVAIERHDHALAVIGPAIGQNALEVAQTRAFALHLFRLGQGAARGEFGRIDQHPPFMLLPVIAPQVIALAIIGAIAQQRDIAAIGREFDPARDRAAQRRAGKDAFEGERGGGRGRAHAHGFCMDSGGMPKQGSQEQGSVTHGKSKTSFSKKEKGVPA